MSDFPFPVKNNKMKPGTWEKKENHITYANWLGEQLGYKTMEDWYSINKNAICSHHGSRLLLSHYNNSPSQFVKNVFCK